MEPSNIDKQLELEQVAGERLTYINRKCEQMTAVVERLDMTQKRIFDLTCDGLKFDDMNEQRFVVTQFN